MAAQVHIEESFRPPHWLRNRHVQSILPSLPTRYRWMAGNLSPLIAASR